MKKTYVTTRDKSKLRVAAVSEGRDHSPDFVPNFEVFDLRSAFNNFADKIPSKGDWEFQARTGVSAQHLLGVSCTTKQGISVAS